jgi:hypothetical protein
LTFKLQREDEFDKWRMGDGTKAEIMHALSLWMLHDKEKQDIFLQRRRALSNVNSEEVEADNANRSDRIVKVICPFSQVGHEWVNLWIGQTGIEFLVGCPRTILKTEGIPPHRLFGYSHASRCDEKSIVAVLSKRSIGQNLAMEIFSHFFSSVVQLIDQIGGTTKENPHQSRMQHVENSMISSLLNDLHLTGLGTRLEFLLGRFIWWRHGDGT